MAKVPEHIRENIYRQVKRDLEPPLWLIHSKVASAVAVGGGVSLFLCGQMGFGLSPLAHRVHHLLMEYVGFLGCTVVCGILFAIIPALLLRLFSSKVQYLLLFRRQRPVLAGWVLAFGSWLGLRNQDPEALFTLALWGLPAVLSFFACAWLLTRGPKLLSKEVKL